MVAFNRRHFSRTDLSASTRNVDHVELSRVDPQDSLLTATVGIPFERIGRTAVEKMNDIVVKKVPKNQAVNGPYLWMDAVLVDASNVDQMLK